MTPTDPTIDTNIITINFRDKEGRYRTRSLFQEFQIPTYKPLFTLNEYDDNASGVISLKRKYLDICDPTEYKVATMLFGSWDHWRKLTQCKWFQPHLEAWREELKIKMRAEVIEFMKAEAKDSSSKHKYEANKYLYELVKPEKASTRGRPSKEEIANNLKDLANTEENYEKDFARISTNYVISSTGTSGLLS